VGYTVEVREIEPLPIAVVRERATRQTLSGKITGSPVWNLVRERGLATGGHNVVVYRNMDKREFDLEVGVDVDAPFESDSVLIATMTPGGLVATTRHTGPYATMNVAHAAIGEVVSRSALKFAGVSWEWYGHWSDDPNQLSTDIYYLLTAEGRAEGP
jgi:effector-binding domain-containing protein